MAKIFIGVDPGMTGAVALIKVTPKRLQVFVDDVADFTALGLIERYFLSAVEVFAYVEKVHSMPGQGVSSVFKFGKATGRAIGWLEALSISYEEITPTKWQKMVFDSGTRTGDNKADSLAMARKLFPSMMDRLKRKRDHNRADALLIAEACRRGHTYK